MQPSVRRRTTLHSRIMRRIYLIVMGAALLLSAAMLIGALFSGQQQLVLSQGVILHELAEDIRSQLAIYANDVRRTAESRSARNFARDTVLNVQSGSLAASQSQLLGDFTALLEANPDEYLAIRYVTATGSIWSSVTNYSSGRPIPNAQVSLNYFRSDPALLSSLALVPGQVAALPLSFYSTPETRASPIPFIRLATPVSVEGSTLGLIQLDVRADALLDAAVVQYRDEASANPARRILLIDAVGRVILDSAADSRVYLNALADRRGVPVGSLISELGTAVLRGDELAVDAGSVIYSAQIVGLGSPVDLGWRLLLLDDEFLAQRAFITAGVIAAAAALGVGALICALLNLLIRRALRYVETLGVAAQPWLQPSQARSSLTPLSQAPPATKDDLEALSAAVRTGTYPRVQRREDLLKLAVPPTLSAVADAPDDIRQLMEAFKTADEYVQRLAAESREQVQRYARNLDIAARISRQTAMLHDLDQLLNRAISLICAEYGFYHAQVFLIDDAGINAVLRYSFGEAGRKLLAEGHRLAVGSPSVIGQVTATGQPVIVHDTEAPSSLHRFNPLLPQTRTEMALPLIAGDEVIGALDIQHTVPNSFREDEISTFQLLADQIALAVANARLIQQVRAQTEALQSASGAPPAWTDADQIAARGYRYDLVDVEAGTLDLPPEQRTSIPIAIRGTVIGSLDAAQPETGFSEGDLNILRAVAERVSLVIENARLFEETQNALQQTSMLYDLSRALNEAEGQEDILRAILRSVMPDASSAQIGLFDEYLPGARPAWMQITADVAVQPDGRRDVLLSGIQLALSDHPILNTMEPHQIVLVNNVERDSRLDETLRAILISLNAQSLVIIPFVVRAVWRGVIMAEFPRARTFSEREGRLFNALIDQAGVAIDNRMLLRENELALEQLERLYTASRITNMAESATDLVMAALATTNDRSLGFEIGIFEGDLDESGWPTRLRIVAISDGDRALGDSRLYKMPMPKDSPLRSREPQIIIDRRPNELNSAPMIAFLRERGRRFAAVFPMFSANRPLALLIITAPEPRDLTTEDYEIYRALTGQMSTVLQNRRLLDQTAAALDETRRLYIASRAIAAAPDAETVYQAAITYIAQGSPALNRIILLTAGPQPSFDAAFMEVVALWQRDPTFVPDLAVIDGEPMLLIPYNGLLASQRSQAAVFNNAERELIGTFAAFGVMMRNHGSKSVALVEIRARQAWYGVIQCEAAEPNAFDEVFIRYASAIADQVAIAIDSLALFRQAQEQARRALALAEAGQLASQIGVDFENQLAAVFQRVAEAARYDRWSLLLADEARTRLEFRLLEYAQPNALMSSEQFFSLSDAGISFVDAFLEQRPITVNQPLEYGAFADMPPPIIEQLGKHLVVPIMLEGKPVGVIEVGRSISAADLDERDVQLVRTLAAQVAVALENRRLFEAAESERTTLRSILETLPAGVLVLNPETLQPLQTNQQAQQLLGQPLDPAEPFSAARYNLYRTGTSSLYDDADLPSSVAARTGDLANSDDITVIHPNGWHVNLLINAAPILNEAGRVTAIVTAMQDITTLRALEDTLQANLKETIALYDTTRALAEAQEVDDVLDRALERMLLQEPTNAYILLLDDDLQGMRVARIAPPDAQFNLPENVLNVERALFIEDTAAPFDELRRERFAVDRDSADQMLLAGVRALVSLPLRARRDVPLGWLVMTYSAPTVFGLEREQFLTTLADSVAIALDNRYLFRSTQQALRETAALYSAATAISRSRDYASIASALMNALAALAPDFYAAYLLHNGRLEELFNEDQDGAPADFMTLIEQHHLLSSVAAIYHDDVRASDAPTPFDESLIALGTVRGFALVTLQSGEMPTGCMIVGYHQPHRFTASEPRYLSAVADSASVVLSNLALFEQIEEALAETRILYETSRALSDASTPRDIVNAIVDHMTDRPIDQVLFLRLSTEDWFDPSATAQVVSAWYPSEPVGGGLEGELLTVEQFPAWRILASPSVVMIDDVAEDSALDPMERLGIESLDIRALAVLPLRVTGRDLGAILISTRQPYQHSYRDLRIYRSLAEQASLRVEASRLLEQTERRARQLVTSAQISQIASSILDLNYLFPRLVNLVRESFGYDHVQIFMMDENDEFAELRASTGEPGRQLLAIKHKLAKGSRSVIGQVTARGEPFIVADTLDSRVIHRPNPYLPNTRAEMAIPLLLKGRVVGALDVQSNTPHAFKEDDVAVLTTLANQIAVAIDNARLYESAQRRASEMSFLFNVTSAAAAASTLEEALEKVADQLRSTLEALSVTIYLPQAYMDNKGSPFTLLRAAALAGTDQPMSEVSEIRLDAPDNLIAAAADDRFPILIGDIAAEPKYLPVIDGARSAAIVPLTAAGQLVGVITMESAVANAYDDSTLTLLLTLAGSLSAIIQNQQLLEQVQKTNQQLLELDQLKSQFLANMSHELRTPLNSIIGFSRVILKGIDGPLTEMQEQDLTTIYNSGQHLLNLINDILDQAKIAAGKMDLQMDFFEIKGVIDAVRSIGIGLVKDKPIDIFVELAPGLPRVYGDEFRTRQVLLNLVSNAAKFTREGSITIAAYVEPHPETGAPMVRVDVTDTGIGIAEKDMPLLFEAFRQVDSSLTRTQGGTGLGLPIAKSLIEMQGGQMYVRSQVNVGSTFSITLPTQPAEGAAKLDTGSLKGRQADKTAESEPAAASGSRDMTETGPLRFVRPIKRQLLLIEDDPDMVDQFRRVLQREGFEIYTASIPLEAKPMASGLHPTIILMDVNFAEGAGWEILEWLKSRDDTRDIPVVVVSLTDEKQRALDMGAFRFVRRPFTPEQLAEAVREAEQESRISRILIIDDHDESIRILQNVLQETGTYRVYSAHNGAEGIAQVARRRPDLVILDLRMPEMDGFQVIRELRSNPETATIPVLVVTADTLDPSERDQLSNLEVIYKQDISAQARRFIESVRMRLNRDN
jgi:GAF domain-containing protein/DNA-binding response OmpR family regulator